MVPELECCFDKNLKHTVLPLELGDNGGLKGGENH